MKQEVKIPSIAESITEVDIAEWSVANGAIVNIDDVLCVIDSDKASLEFPSEFAGQIEILIPEGETVEIGTTIAIIDTSVTASANNSDAGSTSNVSSEAASSTVMSPAATKMVAESGIDPASIAASGKDGRVTKQDVLAHSSAPSSAPASKPKASTEVEIPVVQKHFTGERETRNKMNSMRRKIASRLVMAQHTAAILTTFNEIDMSHVMKLRSQYKDIFEKKHGTRLGFMSFFTKAVVEALKEYPDVNSYIDDNDLVQRNYYDISVAVAGKKGLVVPVIRDADLLSLADIEKTIKGYAIKAKENKLTIEEMTGGGFTISNGGVFGSLLSTPILNPPQTGILGLHKIQERPVVVDGEIVIRPMMYIALSYDHRIIDGKQSVGFLVKIKEIMEDPARILLDV